MTDPITRLNAALEGRYRIEREIRRGRHGYGLSGVEVRRCNDAD
jgi:hypothetical protein